MPQYIPPTNAEIDEIIDIIDRITDKEKRQASVNEVAKSYSKGSKVARPLISKIVKEGYLRPYYDKGVEHLSRIYYRKKIK